MHKGFAFFIFTFFEPLMHCLYSFLVRDNKFFQAEGWNETITVVTIIQEGVVKVKAEAVFARRVNFSS